MPSPFGSQRNASSYYQYGGGPRHYILDWEGLPPGPSRAAVTRALGDEESGDYIAVQATAQLHKSLGDYPVAMSMMSGQQSVLHSGPEQSHIYDSLGIFGFSRNENRLVIVAGLGIAGLIAWRMFKKR